MAIQSCGTLTVCPRGRPNSVAYDADREDPTRQASFATLGALLFPVDPCGDHDRAMGPQTRLHADLLMKQQRINGFDCGYVDRGTGPVMLFVHGFPLDHSMWSYQLDDLSSDFRVIAPDLRGFGTSPDSQTRLTMSQFADDCAALLDAVNIEGPITFCGLSMGGYIGWEFWKRHAERLSAMIMCDTRAGADSREGARTRRVMAEHVLKNGTSDVAELMVPKLFAPESLDQKIDDVNRTKQTIIESLPTSIAAAQLGMSERTDFSEELANINLPILLICGQRDSITTTFEMQQVAKALPHGEYVEIESAGHMAPLEQPEQVNREIRRFIAELPS